MLAVGPSTADLSLSHGKNRVDFDNSRFDKIYIEGRGAIFMDYKMLISAAIKLKNLLILAALFVALAFADNLGLFGFLYASTGQNVVQALIYIISFSGYIGAVIKTLSNEDFREEYEFRQKVKKIQDINLISRRLGTQARKLSDSQMMAQLRKVIEDKEEIVRSFFRTYGAKGTLQRNYLKETIVEQTLNMVVSYLKLFINYSIRKKQVSKNKEDEIAARIDINTRKLGFCQDFRTVEELEKVIELDTKILESIKEEKRELEIVAAKLDYMQSMVNMFKHQVVSSLESEDMLEKLETVVNEATALDNVLEERKRKNRLAN